LFTIVENKVTELYIQYTLFIC